MNRALSATSACNSNYYNGTTMLTRLRWNGSIDPLFCRAFYLEHYPDVRISWRKDPYLHFLKYGRFENRMPNPFLDLEFYERNMIPLAPDDRFDTAFDHFKNLGSSLDLWPCETFDPVYYRDRYERISNTVIVDALEHFLTEGIFLGYFCTHPCYEQMEIP
jgi:hypothetical protein